MTMKTSGNKILEVINLIELEFSRDDKAALHELAWQLVNLTRPEDDDDR
mgnify:CR=1 FL=1|tara:strand:- start:8 stop:154 length:147 start_codon:yes stop_codon:yes gene_type:complete